MLRHQNALSELEPLCDSAIYSRLRQSQEDAQTFFEDDAVDADPLAMGQRIYEVRKDLGPTPRKALKLEEFAAKIAERAVMPVRSPSTIGRWETDESTPTPAEALAIAELGGVRLEWLIRGEEPKYPAPVVEEGLAERAAPESLTPVDRPEKPKGAKRSKEH